MTLYGKNEGADLTVSEKRALRNAIAAELKARALKKSRGLRKFER